MAEPRAPNVHTASHGSRKEGLLAMYLGVFECIREYLSNKSAEH